MTSKLLWVLLASFALAVSGRQPAGAQAHDHGHADHGNAGSKLTLNKGQKWQTDATLRAGMTSIRDEMQAAVGPIHAKQYSPDDYKALAARIEAQLGTILSKCKLPPEVDAQIHLVLAELFAGTDLMKKEGNRMEGAVKIIKGLGAYASHFEHPNWQPIKH